MNQRKKYMVAAVALAMTLALLGCQNTAQLPEAPVEEVHLTEQRPTADILYDHTADTESFVGYTGKRINVSRTDPKYGGPQFIGKLFTEGLSRTPSGQEYATYRDKIEAQGCTVETLTQLARELFSSQEFADAGLTETEQIFCVYRAILNSEPSPEELSNIQFTDAAQLATDLCATAAFAEMLPAIIYGPYYWGSNSIQGYTGQLVMTSEELQQRLDLEKDVVLPQGTLVLMTQEVAIPAGGSLQTEGNPTHYAKMARLIRSKKTGHQMVIMNDNTTMKSIYIEGNISMFDIEATVTGSNVMVIGSHATVMHCRASDAVAHQNLWGFDASEHGYFGYNLITGYGTNHHKTWQDGISVLGADYLVEHNEVVDATDASIAIFRYINMEAPDGDYYSRSQNTIVRYNKMLALGNSAYVGYDHETGNYSVDNVNGHINPALMNGLVSYENQIWTSMRAHYHMVITLSTVPWAGEQGCDRTFGGAVYNNYTPDGCYALTACGITVDKVTDGTVRGNSLLLYVGDWCRTNHNMGARIYCVNEENSSGDFQAGYENRPIAAKGTPFVYTLREGLTYEEAENQLLREAIIYESKQDIPVWQFDSE